MTLDKNRMKGWRKRSATRTIMTCALAVALGATTLAAPQSTEAAIGPKFLQAKMNAPAPSAAQNLCQKYDWACKTSGSFRKLTQDDIDLVRKVNLKVNRQIREVSDSRQYRKLDYWTLPLSARGDCEDFALLKKQQLVAAGFAPERLLIATVLDHNRQGHAVLILRADSGDYVLDNLTNRIKPWQSTRYIFLRMQNPDAPRKWVGLMVRGS